MTTCEHEKTLQYIQLIEVEFVYVARVLLHICILHTVEAKANIYVYMCFYVVYKIGCKYELEYMVCVLCAQAHVQFVPP